MTAKFPLNLKSSISVDNFTTGRITSMSSDIGLEVTMTSMFSGLELVTSS